MFLHTILESRSSRIILYDSIKASDALLISTYPLSACGGGTLYVTAFPSGPIFVSSAEIINIFIASSMIKIFSNLYHIVFMHGTTVSPLRPSRDRRDRYTARWRIA